MEKRKYVRVPTNIDLILDSVYNSGNEVTLNINKPIKIVNISKSGIGFTSQIELPIGYFFNARITFDEVRTFPAVLRVVRNQPKADDDEDEYIVGCEFVGLADILANYIDEYEKEILF